MKKQTLFILSLMSSPIATAADLVPTQFKAIETDLARPELKLRDAYAYRLGLNFVEGHRYILNPASTDLEDASSIRREANFSLMLPYSIETGLALYDNQEAAALSPATDHKKQKLSGAIWARYHIVQTESLDSSLILQYEAGTADRNSFHQASQDKTSLALHLDGSPLAYTQAGIFVGATSRKDESFRGERYNSELLYGTRLSVGVSSLQVFGEAQYRSDKKGQLYEAGLSMNYSDIALQVGTYIPTKDRFLGVPERGVHVGIQMVFGKSASPSSKASKSEEAVSLESEKSPAPAPSPAAAPANSSLVGDESLVHTSDDIKAAEALTLPGADEFQKWEAAQASDKQKPESAAEKAERDYKAQIALEKKAQATKVKNEGDAAAAEEARLRKEYELDERSTKATQAEIEKELNQYTLPDQDDVSWNGLNK